MGNSAIIDKDIIEIIKTMGTEGKHAREIVTYLLPSVPVITDNKVRYYLREAGIKLPRAQNFGFKRWSKAATKMFRKHTKEGMETTKLMELLRPLDPTISQHRMHAKYWNEFGKVGKLRRSKSKHSPISTKLVKLPPAPVPIAEKEPSLKPELVKIVIYGESPVTFHVSKTVAGNLILRLSGFGEFTK